MDQRRDRGLRGLLGFDPVELIVDSVIWKLRSAGRELITGGVVLIAVAVMAAALFVPLLLAGVLITVFGLAVEPYKWIGTILIIVAFAVGLVAPPLLLRRIIRRLRTIITLTEFGDEGSDATGPSPIVPTGPTREQWTARIRALDERLETTAIDPPTTASPQEDSPGAGGSPNRP